ncbi:MAG: DNA-binding protein [Sinobacteraceae bacterium]|nr:DNA-binding protein [Nevskiaceae bacterium]
MSKDAAFPVPAQRAPRLSEDEIVRAAEALLREGQAIPSDRDVLERLGRGSLTTVNRTMRAWRAQAAGKLLDQAGPELPEEIAGLVRGLWTSSLAAARAQGLAELAAERAALDRDRTVFESEAGELRQRAAGLRVAYDLERAANQKAGEEIRQLRTRLEAVTASAAETEARLRSAEADARTERQAREKAEVREAQRAQERDEAVQLSAQRERTLAERHEAEVRLHVQRTEDQRARADRAEAAAAKAAQRFEQREATLEAQAQSLRAETGTLLDAVRKAQSETERWKALAEERAAASRRRMKRTPRNERTLPK